MSCLDTYRIPWNKKVLITKQTNHPISFHFAKAAFQQKRFIINCHGHEPKSFENISINKMIE